MKDDIKLDDRIPHIDLRPHPWRSLKTKGSQRLIPLTKEALWASKRLLEASNDSIFAFPRYCDERGCKANSASGGLNKWLHQYVPENCVIRSFRYRPCERSRAVRENSRRQVRFHVLSVGRVCSLRWDLRFSPTLQHWPIAGRF